MMNLNLMGLSVILSQALSWLNRPTLLKLNKVTGFLYDDSRSDIRIIRLEVLVSVDWHAGQVTH